VFITSGVLDLQGVKIWVLPFKLKVAITTVLHVTSAPTIEEIKHRWTEYCSELYKDSQVINGTEAKLDKLTPAQTEKAPPLLKAEVQKAINLLKKGKSPGTDGITAEKLQAGGDIVLEEMYKICQAVWEEEDIPKEWTKSISVAIPKKEISPNVLITEICHL
jgi:hypothetical protein